MFHQQTEIFQIYINKHIRKIEIMNTNTNAYTKSKEKYQAQMTSIHITSFNVRSAETNGRYTYTDISLYILNDK